MFAGRIGTATTGEDQSIGFAGSSSWGRSYRTPIGILSGRAGVIKDVGPESLVSQHDGRPITIRGIRGCDCPH